MKQMINGQLVDMTESEIQEYNERNTAWNNTKADRKLVQIKEMRLERLRETDWMSNVDVTMSDNFKTYRQALRDLPTHSNWPNLEDSDWPTKPEA